MSPACKKRCTTELRRIEALLRSHANLATRLDLLLGVPGIAERTAIVLILRMPEFGKISREQAAALAALAPFDDVPANTAANAISQAAAAGCADPSTLPPCPPRSTGTLR